MKTLILSVSLFYMLSIKAQMPLDTIYANDSMNVALFFPNPIRQGITGSAHFVFTYNRDLEQYFGLLQATPGHESNLLAITSDGKVYSYILKYAETLTKLNYFIHEDACIGNEKPVIAEPLRIKDSLPIQVDSSGYYKRMSEVILTSKYATIAKRTKWGLSLKLLKVAYHNDEMYVVMEIKNHSGIDFEVNDLNVYIAHGTNKRKASSQRLLQKVLYVHDFPSMIRKQHAYRLVYVLPKQVLGDDEKLEIQLRELKGSRVLSLKTKGY